MYVLFGAAQFLQIGCHEPNSLFHSDFHKTETITQPEVFHMEARPRSWEETLLT